MHSNVSYFIDVASRLIIIDWVFMLENHTSFLGSNVSICVTQKQGTFEDQDLIIVEVKKSMIGKIILHMG